MARVPKAIYSKLSPIAKKSVKRAISLLSKKKRINPRKRLKRW